MSRVRQLALHTIHEDAAGYGSVLMERVSSHAANPTLVLRDPPQPGVSKDGPRRRFVSTRGGGLP